MHWSHCPNTSSECDNVLRVNKVIYVPGQFLAIVDDNPHGERNCIFGHVHPAKIHITKTGLFKYTEKNTTKK